MVKNRIRKLKTKKQQQQRLDERRGDEPPVGKCRIHLKPLQTGVGRRRFKEAWSPCASWLKIGKSVISVLFTLKSPVDWKNGGRVKWVMKYCLFIGLKYFVFLLFIKRNKSNKQYLSRQLTASQRTNVPRLPPSK
jgi:hypothetical protein